MKPIVCHALVLFLTCSFNHLRFLIKQAGNLHTRTFYTGSFTYINISISI